MSDITAIFGLLIIMGLGLPGMLSTWWLLFPRRVTFASIRVERTPWKTFFMGLISLVFWALPAALLLSLPAGPPKALGAFFIFSGLTFATLGAAGIAALMGSRMAVQSSPDLTNLAAFLRGALAFELAVVVPVLGWFIFLPLAFIFSLGAAAFAVLGWVPQHESQETSTAQQETQTA